MPKILGKAERVVEHDGLTIDEVVGNVATKDDTLSVALVSVTKPTAEPWLTLHYDEWFCVTKGRCDMRFINDEGNEEVLQVLSGETCFVAKGERFRPEFPLGDTEYVPICLPAFRPDRCIREEGDVESDVTIKLKELHEQGTKPKPSGNSTEAKEEKYDSIDALFHMCPKTSWDNAVKNKEAYFPPTFEADGSFIHATAVASKLMEVGNHFYRSNTEEWVCLELSRAVLEKKCGIVTKFESAMPVGETETNENWEAMLFPHVYGGIPTCVQGVVANIFPIKRGEDGSFIEIEGLTK